MQTQLDVSVLEYERTLGVNLTPLFLWSAWHAPMARACVGKSLPAQGRLLPVRPTREDKRMARPVRCGALDGCVVILSTRNSLITLGGWAIFATPEVFRILLIQSFGAELAPGVGRNRLSSQGGVWVGRWRITIRGVESRRGGAKELQCSKMCKP